MDPYYPDNGESMVNKMEHEMNTGVRRSGFGDCEKVGKSLWLWLKEEACACRCRWTPKTFPPERYCCKFKSANFPTSQIHSWLRLQTHGFERRDPRKSKRITSKVVRSSMGGGLETLRFPPGPELVSLQGVTLG